ncbi:Threonine dehydrogenase [Faunimonas pinastri]|uniref:Threonine dehydrogenase n=1 Tax=Faunimonas pinastri TaxID=1855383 RepID=A0A1H9A5H0_9HYPH|nr:zinc-dependent alcohol dehydrogenase [Faunimonas pinastri]SEP71909.1 Threonine dehydrogenase [Faunimonas pinastri]
MKALCWHGKGDIRYDTVPDPQIEDGRDVIIKVTSCAICGSDLHLMDGYIPTMESGDVLGHEFMGEVVDVGRDHKKFKVGDKIVVPFTICCGECYQCKRGNFSVCERSNRNGEMAKKMFGHQAAGLFGYSHLTGGYAGGQAEYVRVPFADVAPVKAPDGVPDEQLLFLTDIFPTGWMAAKNCEIEPTDTVAVWGCGPVGQFCIKSAILLGAERVIAIDLVPERLAMARAAGAETIDSSQENVLERLNQMTHGHGPEKCIDSVGMEAHAGGSIDAVIDKAKAAAMLGTDRPHVLREAIMACRPAGIVSVPGVYGGLLDKIPFGAAMNKGLTIRTGQTHVNRYIDDLMHRVLDGQIDPSFVITHRAKLEDGPDLYHTFRDKKDGCIKVVMTP